MHTGQNTETRKSTSVKRCVSNLQDEKLKKKILETLSSVYAQL